MAQAKQAGPAGSPSERQLRRLIEAIVVEWRSLAPRKRNFKLIVNVAGGGKTCTLHVEHSAEVELKEL